MAINTFERYELKFQVPKEKKILLEAIIREHMVEDKFCLNGQKYLIRNIYYDTKDNTLIHFSTTKPVRHKEKLRARKYGTIGDGKDKVFLEIKKKTEGIVSKRRITLTEKELEDFIDNKIIPKRDNYFDNQVLKEMLYFLSIYDVRPATFISYERLAFFDKIDPTFRITFDDCVQARREDFNFDSTKECMPLLPDDIYLMEVKIVNGMPFWFARALSELKIYSSSFSKYGTEYRLTVQGGNKKCSSVF